MARKRKGRKVNGVILVDKHQGESSNHIVQKVKRLFGAEKAGHTGALDPLATGMLPVCLGEATKFSQYLLDADKTYITTAKLGIRTDTSDSEGQVIETKKVNVSTEHVQKVLDLFKGTINQVPSMFSALKHNGKPLYYYARQGIEVDRSAREITIHTLRLLSHNETELDLEVRCSKGTYIRTLVDDIGQALGCGAHVTMLRRTQVDNYPAERMIEIIQLEQDHDKLDALLLPMDTPVLSLPCILISDRMTEDFSQGRQISELKLDNYIGLVRIYRESDEQFLGLGHIDSHLSLLSPKRVVVY